MYFSWCEGAGCCKGKTFGDRAWNRGTPTWDDSINKIHIIASFRGDYTTQRIHNTSTTDWRKEGTQCGTS